MKSNLNLLLIIFLTIFIIACVFFSPLLSVVFLIFFLTFLPLDEIKGLRFFISCICYYCIIIILFSKDYNYAAAPDYLIYSQANSILKNSNFLEIFELFPNEFGWPLVYWLLNKLNINIVGVNDVALYNTIISLSIFVFWFEVHALKLINKKYHGIVTATNILFMSFVTLGFLQRQALSVAFLLFAISNYNNRKFYLFLFFSTVFHNTSLVVGLIYRILIKINLTKKLIISMVFIFLIVRIFFIDLINLLVGLDLFGAKFGFYTRLNSFEIVSFRLALYGMLLFFIHCMFYKNIDNYFKNIITFSSLIFVCFLGINLVSERLNFILMYCLGLFLSFHFLPKNYKYLIVLNLLMLIVFVLEKNGIINSDFMLWQRYEWFGNEPLYYWRMLNE